MSAGKTWHEDAPKKIGPATPMACLSWAGTSGNQENPVLSQQPLEDDETRAEQLHALRRAEIDKHFAWILAGSSRQPQLPTFAVWAKTGPMPPALQSKSPAARRTLLVQTPPYPASPRLMPRPVIRPTTGAAPKAAELLPVAIALQLPCPMPVSTAEPAPPVTTPRLFTSVEEIPFSPSFFSRCGSAIRRFAAIAAPAMKRTGRAAKEFAVVLNHRLAAAVTLRLERMRTTRTQRSISRELSAKTKPAPVRQRKPRTQTPISTGFRACFGPRRSPRLVEPPVVAYCWSIDTPQALKIADISSSGLHMLTDVRWPRGGAISMTLRRTDRAKEAPGSWIVADFVVVRWCEDGLAGALLPPSPYSIASQAENCASEKTLKRFVKQLAVPARGL